MQRLNRDAAVLALHFNLRYASIEAERANVKSRYGVCYSDGVIKIRLRHAVSGRQLKYSSLVNTLCHELAHLRHFNHGERFRAFYQRILEFARARKIYRPAVRGSQTFVPQPPTATPKVPAHRPPVARDHGWEPDGQTDGRTSARAGATGSIRFDPGLMTTKSGLRA